MYMKEFLEKNHTTRDTIRHYIEIGLLNPQKKGSWYFFSEKDMIDFQNIVQLKALGFSLEGVKRIKQNHDQYCGTLRQWKANLTIVEGEIENIQQQIAALSEKQECLTEYRQQLLAKITEEEPCYHL